MGGGEGYPLKKAIFSKKSNQWLIKVRSQQSALGEPNSVHHRLTDYLFLASYCARRFFLQGGDLKFVTLWCLERHYCNIWDYILDRQFDFHEGNCSVLRNISEKRIELSKTTSLTLAKGCRPIPILKLFLILFKQIVTICKGLLAWNWHKIAI